MIGWKKFPKFGFAFSSQGFSSFFEDSLLNDYDFVVSLFVEGISVKKHFFFRNFNRTLRRYHLRFDHLILINYLR